jgi:phosphoglycerol transferase
VVPRHVDVLLDGVRVAQAELSPQTRIQLAIAIPKPGALVQIQTSPDAAPPGNGDSRTLAFSQLFDGPLLCGGAAQ